MAETKHHGGAIVLRPDSKAEFDELVMSDRKGHCLAHFEMMDDRTLWVGLYPKRKGDPVVHVWVGIKKGKLSINCDPDA